MSDLLVIFAGAVVAPVGFVVCFLVAFVVARSLYLEWRDERRDRQPVALSLHQQAAVYRFNEGAHAVLFASALAGLVDDVTTDQEREALVMRSTLMLLDAEASFEDAAALLQEDAA